MDHLNKNELEVLRLLWEEAPRKPGEIQQGFLWPIDNGTLRSVLVAMVDAELLRRERRGRAFVYWPRIRRETQFRQMIRRVAEVFTGGSTGQLLMELAANEKLTADELAKLKRIADGGK